MLLKKRIWSKSGFALKPFDIVGPTTGIPEYVNYRIPQYIKKRVYLLFC